MDLMTATGIILLGVVLLGSRIGFLIALVVVISLAHEHFAAHYPARATAAVQQSVQQSQGAVSISKYAYVPLRTSRRSHQW